MPEAELVSFPTREAIADFANVGLAIVINRVPCLDSGGLDGLTRASHLADLEIHLVWIPMRHQIGVSRAFTVCNPLREDQGGCHIDANHVGADLLILVQPGVLAVICVRAAGMAVIERCSQGKRREKLGVRVRSKMLRRFVQQGIAVIQTLRMKVGLPP